MYNNRGGEADKFDCGIQVGGACIPLSWIGCRGCLSLSTPFFQLRRLPSPLLWYVVRAKVDATVH